MPAEPLRLEPRDRELLEAVARRVVDWRMEVPAVLALESVKPLSLLGSQAMFFFEPMVLALFHWPGYRRFAELIEHREHVERFARMIEAEAGRRRAERAGAAGAAGGPSPRA